MLFAQRFHLKLDRDVFWISQNIKSAWISPKHRHKFSFNYWLFGVFSCFSTKNVRLLWDIASWRATNSKHNIKNSKSSLPLKYAIGVFLCVQCKQSGRRWKTFSKQISMRVSIEKKPSKYGTLFFRRFSRSNFYRWKCSLYRTCVTRKQNGNSTSNGTMLLHSPISIEVEKEFKLKFSAQVLSC